MVLGGISRFLRSTRPGERMAGLQIFVANLRTTTRIGLILAHQPRQDENDQTFRCKMIAFVPLSQIRRELCSASSSPRGPLLNAG